MDPGNSKKACNKCGVRGPRTKFDFLVLCSECDWSWHGQTCLPHIISLRELKERNQKTKDSIVEGGWADWVCKECRDTRARGVQYNFNAEIAPLDGNYSRQSIPSQRQNRGKSQGQNQRQAQVFRKTAAPVNANPTLEVDLTLESDSEPEVMIIDNPRRSRAQVPAPKAPIPDALALIAPPTNDPPRGHQAEINLVSPEQTPPRQSADEDSQVNEVSNNPLRYLPTPELQSRSHSSCPDLGVMRLGTPTRNTHPAFPFPEPTPFAHRFGTPDLPYQPRTRPLPPALRSSQVSILAEHLLEATTECRAVRTIGIRELKANGWTLERRDQEVALLINAQPVNKGKERALGERTRDWAPLVQREEMAKTAEQEHTSGQPPAAQKRSVFHLIPPPVDTSKTVWTPAVHPPRQPRKRSAVPRDPTVKVESLELSLTL